MCCAYYVVHHVYYVLQIANAVVARRHAGTPVFLLTDWTNSNDSHSLVWAVLADMGIVPLYIGLFRLHHKYFVISDYLCVGGYNWSHRAWNTTARRSGILARTRLCCISSPLLL